MNVATKPEVMQQDLVPSSGGVPSVADGLVHMIERVARDASVDLGRMEKLMEMYERMKAQESKQLFNDAMSDAQTEMRPVAADKENKQTSSKYASYAALDQSIRPVYTKHGFGLSFDTGEGAPDNCVRIICDVSHRGGHTRQYHIDMPADGKGAKGNDVMTKTHATGSAVLYGRRYLVGMIFNIAVGAWTDDDGNAASDSGERITEEQVNNLSHLLKEKGAPLAGFLKWAGVERLADIPVDHYDLSVAAIKKYVGPQK